MNRDTNLTTRLTDVIISFSGFSRLTRPIRPANGISSTSPVWILVCFHVLGMMFIRAFAGTKFESLLKEWPNIFMRTAIFTNKVNQFYFGVILFGTSIGARISNARRKGEHFFSAVGAIPSYFLTCGWFSVSGARVELSSRFLCVSSNRAGAFSRTASLIPISPSCERFSADNTVSRCMLLWIRFFHIMEQALFESECLVRTANRACV